MHGSNFNTARLDDPSQMLTSTLLVHTLHSLFWCTRSCSPIPTYEEFLEHNHRIQKEMVWKIIVLFSLAILGIATFCLQIHRFWWGNPHVSWWNQHWSRPNSPFFQAKPNVFPGETHHFWPLAPRIATATPVHHGDPEPSSDAPWHFLHMEVSGKSWN